MSYVTFGPDRVTAEPELTPDQLINISSLSLFPNECIESCSL